MDQYIKPEIVLKNFPRSGIPNVAAAYSIKNVGRRRAEEVELGIIAGKNDLVRVAPDLGNSITYDGGDPINNIRVVVPYLTPGEAFLVSIWREPDSPDANSSKSSEQKGELDFAEMLPAVLYLRSIDGAGQIAIYKNDGQE